MPQQGFRLVHLQNLVHHVDGHEDMVGFHEPLSPPVNGAGDMTQGVVRDSTITFDCYFSYITDSDVYMAVRRIIIPFW